MIITSIDKKKLAVSLAIPLAVGGLASLLNRSGFAAFADINQPSFAPPPILFPIVWTLLYLLMGVSFYLIWDSSRDGKREAVLLYGLQLAANFLWTFLFFGMGQFFAAWIEILVLLALIAGMLITFFRVSRVSAYLQIPYFLWVCFASYLNYRIYLLNGG